MAKFWLKLCFGGILGWAIAPFGYARNQNKSITKTDRSRHTEMTILTDNGHPWVDDGRWRGRSGSGRRRHLLSDGRVQRHRKSRTSVDVRGSIGRQEPRGTGAHGAGAAVGGVPMQSAASASHLTGHRVAVRRRYRPKIHFRASVGGSVHRVEVVERIRQTGSRLGSDETGSGGRHRGVCRQSVHERGRFQTGISGLRPTVGAVR